MPDILFTTGLRLMRASWAFFAMSLVIPGHPGWISDLGMAVAAAGAWDLLVAWHFWRRGQAEAARTAAWQREYREEIARCERDLAMASQAAASLRPAGSHVHEVGGELVEGTWQGGFLVAVPNDEPCVICADKAGRHYYGAR